MLADWSNRLKSFAILSLAFLSLFAFEVKAGHLTGNCIPYDPSQCTCKTQKTKWGPITICRVIAPPSTCGACVNGCNNNGECADEPYDQEGKPLLASTEEWCVSLDVGETTDVDELSMAFTCESGYGWICNEEWCTDTLGAWWRTMEGQEAFLRSN